jgi:hypothetical protein
MMRTELYMRAMPASVLTPTFSPVRTARLQRACDGCQEQAGPLRRAAIGPGSARQAPPLVHEVLHEPGQSLGIKTRAMMESRFGHDFSRVRVHAGAQAAESARAVDALAYTVGSDVVFGQGQYMPQTAQGQRLLAHELSHVVQQQSVSRLPSPELPVGEPHGELEQEAGWTADRMAAAPVARSASIPVPSRGHAAGPVLQRQAITTVPGLSPLSSPAPLIQMAAEMIDLAPGEAVTAANPKLVLLASTFKTLLATSPEAYIDLSAYLTQAAEMSSDKESQERRQLQERMNTLRSTLGSLGVPAGKVHIQPAYAFSTTRGGQVSASLYKEPRPLLLPGGPVPSQPVPGQPGTGPKAPSMPSLSDLTTFKFKAGPFEFKADLPKSVTAKLPVSLGAARSLSFELEAETSGSFSFSVTLDDKPHLRVSLKAGLSLDKDKGTTGSAGLTIESLSTVCHADNPEDLKTKIKSAGDKLKKAGQEYNTATTNEDRLSKLVDMAGAIGDMYGAVDKSKKGCKQVPWATFKFGIQGPLAPTPGEPPGKQSPSYIGGSLTIPF